MKLLPATALTRKVTFAELNKVKIKFLFRHEIMSDGTWLRQRSEAADTERIHNVIQYNIPLAQRTAQKKTTTVSLTGLVAWCTEPR